MKWYIILIIVLAALFILSFVYIIIVTYIKCFKRGKEIPLLECDLRKTKYYPYINIIKEHYDYFNNLKYDTLEVKSFDNLLLKANYYNNNSDKTVIFFHGYRATPLNNYQIIGKYLYEKGYNLLMVYQRCHGLSEGKYTTFGINEKYDVISWVNKINDLYNPNKIVLYGLSMGAGTIMLSTKLGLPNNVSALVLDCGFDNSYQGMKNGVKRAFKFGYHTITFFINLLIRMHGINLKKGLCYKALENNEIKAIFIHGNEDKLIPISMGKNNYNHNKGEKYFIETNMTHAMSIYENTNDLVNKIIEYIEK